MSDELPAGSEPPTGLTGFQTLVARAFFELPESREFLLAGGAALIAHGLVERLTQDLDLFASGAADVAGAAVAFRSMAAARGWTVQPIRESDTFQRMVVRSGDDVVLVDLALDAPSTYDPVLTPAGPTFDPAELAGRKLTALFDRAEARDFSDVFALAKRFGRDRLLLEARVLDAGMTDEALAEMFDRLSRVRDEDLPIEASLVIELRTFFAEWAAELRREPPE